MQRIDNDPKIRDLSRLLWEKAGRPNGHEHVYWALASREFDRETDGAVRKSRIVAR